MADASYDEKDARDSVTDGEISDQESPRTDIEIVAAPSDHDDAVSPTDESSDEEAVPETNDDGDVSEQADDSDATQMSATFARYEEEIARNKDDIAHLRSQLSHSQQEMVKMRRRLEQEKKEQTDRTKTDVLSLLIPILDDLDDALAYLPESLWGDSWVAGILLIGDRIQSLLHDGGIERLIPLHEPFSPHYHEAVSLIEGAAVPEGTAHNTIVGVFRPGYVVDGRVVRPAQVQVAKIRKDS